jgi:hypothetical protein
MHSNGKGISASALPFRRTQPSWSKATPEDVSDQIFKFAKSGVILRDSHGIPQVKFVTGNKILRILKTNGGFLFFMERQGVSSEGRASAGTVISEHGQAGTWDESWSTAGASCEGGDARQGTEGTGWRKLVQEQN